MINIAICDDDDFFCENLTSFLKINYNDTIKHIDDFSNGSELLLALGQSEFIYDFIFLDLYMPGLDGIFIGNKLRTLPSYASSVIFYITAYDSPVTRITDIHPFAYIIKPVNYSILKHKFDSALNQHIDSRHYILLESKKITYKFIPNDILYFESMGRKSIIHFSNGQSNILHITLSDIHQSISDRHPQFVRVHASYIVNLIHINEVTHSHLYLNNNVMISISSSYRKSFFEKFRAFFI